MLQASGGSTEGNESSQGCRACVAVSTALGHLAEGEQSQSSITADKIPFTIALEIAAKTIGNFEQDRLNTKQEFSMHAVEFRKSRQFALWKEMRL